MFIRFITAPVIALLVSGFYFGHIMGGEIFQFDALTFLCFLLATLLAALASLCCPPKNCNKKKASPAKTTAHSSPLTDDSTSSIENEEFEREEGTVKWFNVSKGFGFITRGNGEDIFVHYRSIRGQGRRRLFDGQTVTFTVIDNGKGLQADDVDVLS